MKKGRKVFLIVLAVIVTLPLCFVCLMYASTWYYRWRAEKLLVVMKSMEPGVTTEAQYMAALKTLNGHYEKVYSDVGEYPDSAAVENLEVCEMAIRLCQKSMPVFYALEGKLMASDASFLVLPTFEQGHLTELKFEEIQAHFHCCGASVTRHAGVWAGKWPREDTFHGYQVTEGMGLNRSGGEWHVDVDLDQRATSEQVEKALDFHFWCFTRVKVCDEATQFLEPPPNP